MTSNITKSFNQRKKFGLRMATGGILSTKQDDSTLFSAPGSDPSSKLALSLASQAQPQDAVAANSSLSNTDRFKIANPTGDAYGVDGKMKGVVSVAPGSSAENSIFNEQGSLRQNMTDASNMSRLRRVDSMTGGNGLDMYRNSLSSGRGAGARFGLGLRTGGVVMPVEGEGTGTSDDVPVVLAGHEVNVSNGEGVAVLPAKTMRDKTAVDNIEKIIENSNGKPVNKGLRDGMAAEQGVMSGDEKKKVVLRDTPYLRGGAANGTQDEYTMAVNGPEAGSRTQVGVINGGPGVGVYGAPPVQKAVEKNKWWHGKATAADSNAYLAGTPQHQEVINDELKARGLSVAAIPTPSASQLAATPNPKAAKLTEAESIAAENMRDARMTQLATTPRNTLSDAQLAVMDKVIPDRNAQPTLKNGAWTSKNDVTAEYNDSLAGTSPGDPRRLQDGHGIASMRQADGSYKNIVVTPSQYIGADGKPTSKWEDTQAYKDAIARQETNKQTLRDLQYQNAVNSINSHNPAYQREGLRTISAMLARDNVEADKAAKAASLNLQSSQLRRELNKDAQTQANADRTYEAGRDDKHEARVNEVLDSFAGDKKADGYAQRRALMERFKNNFDQVYKGDRKGYLKALQTELGLELALEEHGRKWNIFGEKPWDGGISAITPEKAPWYRLGDQVYKDSHGRQASAYDLRSSLTPDMVAALEARIASSR